MTMVNYIIIIIQFILLLIAFILKYLSSRKMGLMRYLVMLNNKWDNLLNIERLSFIVSLILVLLVLLVGGYSFRPVNSRVYVNIIILPTFLLILFFQVINSMILSRERLDLED